MYEDLLEEFVGCQKEGQAAEQIIRRFGSYLGRQLDEKSVELLQIHRERCKEGSALEIIRKCLEKQIETSCCLGNGEDVNIKLNGVGVRFTIDRHMGMLLRDYLVIRNNGEVVLDFKDGGGRSLQIEPGRKEVIPGPVTLTYSINNIRYTYYLALTTRTSSSIQVKSYGGTHSLLDECQDGAVLFYKNNWNPLLSNHSMRQLSYRRTHDETQRRFDVSQSDI
ncbi:6671_t:CDS:2 [Paraglomus occultum]|uniref:6671_t:CDS:1 n=1 Tax=Paraglomus occultum TaxID=144539 RepID=A0A9N9GM35_9GLOM|nr:6671_t:CDS:2 [Paraglomus occultum]